MTSRYIIVGPESASITHDVVDELAVLLEERGSFEYTNALVSVDASSTATSPQAALPNILEALRALRADFVPVNDIGALDARTFDAVSWNLGLATSARAGVVLVLDAEGVGAELLTGEIRVFVQRTEATQAKLVAVALPTGVAPTVEAEVPVLPLPLGAQALDALLATPAPNALTPLTSQADLVDRAHAQHKRIVMPEPGDDQILLAATEVLARGIADITLAGEANAVSVRAVGLSIDLSAASIVSVDDPTYAEKYAAEFARLHAKKGVIIKQARKRIKGVSYFTTLMVHMGDTDDTTSDATCTTAHTIVPSFRIIEIAPGVSIVSSILFILMKDQVWAFGDCAVNLNPTPEQLADTAVASARTAAQFGVEPRVAMLSYSTGTSGSGPVVDTIVETARLTREKAPELTLKGPIRFDAAVDMAVTAEKLPDSPVVGRANISVFPSLGAGSIGYKTVQCSSGAVAVGPVLQGLNKPVNNLSHGALVEDVVNMVALTAVQAQN